MIFGSADSEAGKGERHRKESAGEHGAAVDDVTGKRADHGAAKGAEVVGHVV